MRTWILTSALGLGALGVLARETAPGGWVMPFAVRAGLVVLLAAAVFALWRARRARAVPRRPAGWGLLWLLLLALAVGLRLFPVRPDPETWSLRQEARLRQRFEVVRAAVLEVAATARQVGDRAFALAQDSSLAQAAGPERRVQLFEGLKKILEENNRRRVTPELGGLGVQLFDARGELLAWAGAPHAEGASRRLTHFGAGGEADQTYFRRSGVYTLLTHERRRDAWPAAAAAARADSAPAPAKTGPRVVVDAPVEVHYQLSNRFLQSGSLARGLSGRGVEVDLQYDASTIPPYLTKDEVVLVGGEEQGMQIEAVVRDARGVAVVLCRLAGLPYADDVARAGRGIDQAARWLFLLVVTAGFLAFASALLAAPFWRRRGQRVWPLLAIAGVWGLRLAVAGLDLPPGTSAVGILNPASFAMAGLGRTLRSPLDLLLTGATFAATAALLFLMAARARRAAWGRPGRRPAPGAAGAWGAAFLAAAVAGLTVRVTLALVAAVVAHSNPVLVGSRLELGSPAVLCIHLGLLAGVGALFCLALLGIATLAGGRAGRAALGLVSLALGVALWLWISPVVALVGVALLWAGLRLPNLLADERFTSFALACFALVALAATLTSEAIHGEYFRDQQALVRERAERILHPDDAVRSFVLDEVLDELKDDPTLARAQGSNQAAERGALAFQIWARSMLSRLGYSCRVRVHDAGGQLVSDFEVEMPYGSDTPPRDLLERARSLHEPVTQAGSVTTAAGRMRYYRGAVRLAAPPGDETYRGAVVVDLPYAYESLDLAANPAQRTPELLRNVQEDGVGPRLAGSERLLLAWLEGGFVVESSTPYLGVARPLAREQPGKDGWQRLRLEDGDYLSMQVPAGARALLAGFRLAPPLERLLDWAQIASFDFVVTLAMLLGFLALGRWPRAARGLPLLLVPKRLGFQQKLMVAFLVVSLLPSVVLSLATRDIMRDRSERRNRDAALAKARSAEAALADVVRRELDAVRGSEYLHGVLAAQEQLPVRDIGTFSEIAVFRADGNIVVDETLSNLSDAQSRQFVEEAPRTVFASRDLDGRTLFLGALEPLWFSRSEGLSESAPDAQLYYLYYRRRLTDKLLRDLAPILNTDISGFLGADLVVSNQKSLATAGLLPSLVPAEPFVHVQLRHNRYAVAEESTGRQRSFAGYLPLEDRFGERIGTLSVSQLLQPDEFAVEVERTRALVVGLSTLMFVLTLALGVVFASRIFDPVRSLIEGTRRIAGGDLAFRLRARAADEIGELERSFNNMAAKLQGARWALEERRRYLEAVLGNIASGVVATDARGGITAANPAAYRILRLPAGDLAGRTWSELAAAAPESGLGQFWARISAAPDGEVVEVGLLRAEERLTLRVIVTELRAPEAEGRESLGRVAIFEDVTELIRSKKLAAWAEMARQVAHEIKNPLTPMKLSAQFMQQAYHDRSDQFPQVFGEGMATIIEQIESLRRIATEFSSFGRVQKLKPQAVDLGELLRRVTAPYFNLQGLEMELGDGTPTADAAPGALPAAGAPGRFPGDGVQVLGDEDGLRKVFTNVLENAREAMNGRGRITLRVLPPANGRVDVHVADHGVGLSSEAASRLFEPYFSTKSSGTGLGLAITKGILEELGGAITIVNLPDGGAEACITLALY